MKYTTGRDDITGQFGEERNFYEAFSTANRYFVPDHRMSGMDINMPVFIFRQTCGEMCTHTQLEYALNWRVDGWNLYRFDRDNGLISEEYAGTGYDEFVDLVERNNLSRQSVAFASGEPGK
jgi:hypothetical protein